MDLPKNITQIGESDHNCKIYVEDYVISFIKQMNQLAGDKEMAVALYGVRKEENDVSYLFFYGACKLDFLSREVRHLSQAQSQEIEKLRKRYFQDYQFLGYRILNGEMVEGFHICEQGICRYINGYACFYEKNDQMLAYMLDTRKEDVPPEEVDQEKYERVRKRQEERRAANAAEIRPRTERRRQEGDEDSEEPVLETGRASRRSRETAGMAARKNAAAQSVTTAQGKTVKIMRASVVGVFLLLCIVGLTTLNGTDKLEKLQVAARQLVSEFTEKKIPDSDGAVAAMSSSGQSDTLVAEDKLADAIQKENAGQGGNGQAADPSASATSALPPAETQSPSESQTPETTPVQGETADPTGQAPQDTGAGESQASGQDQQSADPGGQPSEGGGPDGSAVPPVQEADNTQTPAEPEPQPSQPASSPVAYVIQKGDTLIGISKRQYGTEDRVKEICALNDISNPDDIRFGQKILLP